MTGSAGTTCVSTNVISVTPNTTNAVRPARRTRYCSSVMASRRGDRSPGPPACPGLLLRQLEEVDEVHRVEDEVLDPLRRGVRDHRLIQERERPVLIHDVVDPLVKRAALRRVLQPAGLVDQRAQRVIVVLQAPAERLLLVV